MAELPQCKELLDAAAARVSRVEMQVYPGAYHGFDGANSPIHEFPEYRTSAGVVPIQDTDPAARQDALTRVPAFSLVSCRTKDALLLTIDGNFFHTRPVDRGNRDRQRPAGMRSRWLDQIAGGRSTAAYHMGVMICNSADRR
jgi:hypothetical protein